MTMRTFTAKAASCVIDWSDGSLHGGGVRKSVKLLSQLRGIFADESEWQRMDPGTVVYRVEWIAPVQEGTEGGLFWGNTTIEPGRVGEEYFMTHGHFHDRRNRGEFYSTVRGEGMLVFMDAGERGWAEKMTPGSLHFIPGATAHRVVNIGDNPLRFIACWPSDAGHDYSTIAQHGFSLRVVCRNGVATLVERES
jgi:glucose-6-phosphate isomerase